MADYAIHDTTLEAIADTIRKKDGSVALIDPADYADRVNLMGMLEVKTAAKASICNFSDGADDVPIVEGVFEVDYDGNPHGEMNIYHFGKNLLDDTKKGIFSNGMYLSFNETSQQGVCIPYLPAGTYTFKPYFAEGVSALGIMIGTTSPSSTIVNDWSSASSVTFTLSEPKKNIYIMMMRSQGWQLSDVIGAQLEVGSAPSDYEEYKTETVQNIYFFTSTYGGFYNSKTGILEKTKASDGTDLNPPVDVYVYHVSFSTFLGVNNFFCDTGDTAITYRSSGTVTPVPVQPVLVSKNITENGTYDAEDDDADGYSEVNVSVQSAICERLMYARCVNNDQEEIPAMSNIEQDTNYSSYLSYDSSTKKFTVLQDFTGVVVAWVYAYRTYESSRPDGAFYVNSTQMLAYTATGNAQGSTGGRSGIYNFKQGDTFWMYTPSRRGYPQQNCKVYRVSALNDNVFTFADEEDVE